MKKILAILLVTLSLTVSAKETVTLAYSWGAADGAANFYRALVEEANQQQSQYTFIFDAKPGAGGTVAANYTNNNPTNTVWLNSPSAFIRPNLFPESSHNIGDFRILIPVCTNNVIIESAKYKNWKEIPRDAKLSIGISGLGATTHLIALQIVKNYPNMQIVPFKSSSESLLNALNGSVDLSVGFHTTSEQYTRPGTVKQIYWLGQTGTHSVKGTELLTNQGFSKDLANMSTPHEVFASRKMPETKFLEIRKILSDATNSKSVRSAMAVDNCAPIAQMSDTQINDWYNSQIVQWRRLTQGINIDK